MIVNDSVMGGISSSTFEITNTFIKFTGHVSLQNNGGFASLRMLWPFEKIKGVRKLQLRLKGDGKTYQFRLRTNRGIDGASYVHEFKTIKDKLMSIEMDIGEFIPSFRGRVLKDMPKLLLKDVQQMGILISNKQIGDFNIHLMQLVLEN
jgi:monofunctional biosynthetic peptidoglycan transglycosylase